MQNSEPSHDPLRSAVARDLGIDEWTLIAWTNGQAIPEKDAEIIEKALEALESANDEEKPGNSS